MSDEVQTCPDRMNLPGPWRVEEGIDRWITNRWTTDEALDLRERAELQAENPGNTYGSRLWKWSWGPPRTCSFCGGIHPEDAIRLVTEGWEVEGTGKSYKRYLEPPGSRTRREATLASILDQSREPFEGVPSVWTPTPPVKLYVSHFNAVQCVRFNAAMGAKG